MAKNEQNREDLMREASALSPRAELATPAFAESIVFGFRSSGGLSIFFGADPVYQFNSTGELRRAFVRGDLFKSVKGRLQRLHRERNANQVTLWQSELDDNQQNEFLGEMQSHCDRLRDALARNLFELVDEIPKGSGAIEWLQTFSSKIASPPRIAVLPNAR